ncbi:hypothetical protein N3114_12735 (plasmid) [Aliarcobacter butzleri]|uniref:hypothetical protein n=1 Tax=Aliarcobacter butzleri TaxID=28197 RepID=UPI0021B31621|nr:hypothetical protein [Aliarcobacter butzleri]UXC30721.1 hypothetical protein N3114_12735 [Aliarcobacter butzleri]
MSEEEKKKLELIKDFSSEQIVLMIIYFKEIEIYKNYLQNIHPELDTFVRSIQEITKKAKYSQILLTEEK